MSGFSAASPLPILAPEGIHCAAGPKPVTESLPWVSRPPPPPAPRNTTTHSPPFRSSLLAAIETSLPGPGPRRASWWPSSLLSRLPKASPLLGIGPVQDAEGHWALVAEPGTDRQRALPRPCGSDLLLSSARRALGSTQTSAPRDTYEATPAPASLCAAPGSTASSLGGLATEVSGARSQRTGRARLFTPRLQMCVIRKRHFSSTAREKGRHKF